MIKKNNIEELQKLAQSRGGKCLSGEYATNRIHLQWQCGNGHVWSARPTNIRTGTWCPFCVRNIKLTIGEMQKLAESKGGQCLSTEYINNNSKLKWQCKDGHIFEKKPTHVKDRGQWCPECFRRKKIIYSNEFLISELKRLSMELGRIPKMSDLQNHPDFPDPTTYRTRFGGWIETIEIVFNKDWGCQDCGRGIAKRAIKSNRCAKCSHKNANRLKRERYQRDAQRINYKRREEYQRKQEYAIQLDEGSGIEQKEEAAENILEKALNVFRNIGKG